MKYKVKRKQPNSSMCLVCGIDNQLGLKSFFYELENGDLLGIFTAKDEHQSYPGRVHGGIASSILDETIGRAIMMHHEKEVWGVTIEFTARYKKPVPIGEKLHVIGRITQNSTKCFEGTGEILLPDGNVAVEGKGRYIKMPIEKIADFDQLSWEVINSDCDFEHITLPKNSNKKNI